LYSKEGHHMSLIGWWPFTTNRYNQGTIVTPEITNCSLEENGKLG